MGNSPHFTNGGELAGGGSLRWGKSPRTIEDTNHFLFLCPFFATRRATLGINVIAILRKYGVIHLGNQSHLYINRHRTINLADNRKILLSNTRRFSTYIYSPTQSSQPCRNHVYLLSLLFYTLLFLYVSESCIYFFLLFFSPMLPWLWLNFDTKPGVFLE